MQLKSNIEEVIKRLQEVAQSAQQLDFSEALTVGVNAAMGAMKFRVFNTGRDAKGIPFGKYIGKKSRATNRKFKVLKYGDTEESAKEKKKLKKRLAKNANKDEQYTEYEKERLSKGRQVAYKDLELTGGLRRGIVIVRKDSNRVVVAIPDKKNLAIARGQQVQISKIVGQEVDIFGLSDDERDLMKTNINEALKQLYARVFNP